jgi:hypothetical protein
MRRARTISNFKLSGLWILQHWLHGSYKQGTTDHPPKLQAVQPIGARYTRRLHQQGHRIQKRVQPASYPSLLSLKSLHLCIIVSLRGRMGGGGVTDSKSAVSRISQLSPSRLVLEDVTVANFSRHKC